MTTRASVFAVAAALALGLATLHGAGAVSRQHADAFAKKLAVITQTAQAEKPVSRKTPVSEDEVNSWFTYRAQPLLPEGVSKPTLRAIGNGKLMGDITVDLEAVGRKRGSGGTLDVWSYLGGKVPLTVTGILHTKEGRGRFELQSASVSGVPLPKTLLQELLSYYSRSENHPQGFKLEDPFELPAKIREIQIGQGQAVVVQ